VKHRYPAIDLIALATKWTAKEWSHLMRKCERENDLERLRATLYGIQRGMDILAKSHLNTPKLCELFAIWTRSIEVSAKRIFRKKYPSILETKRDKTTQISQAELQQEFLNKKKRDVEYQKFLRDSRF
jgi:hypothetical protein